MANTHRMGELIDNILEYSRIGRARLAASADRSAAAGRGCGERTAAGLSGERMIVIHPLPRASVDATMMRQVFGNLVGNAFKFSTKTPRRGSRSDAARTTIGAEFYVRDNGAGFDMKYADKLFGMFQRMHGANEFQRNRRRPGHRQAPDRAPWRPHPRRGGARTRRHLFVSFWAAESGGVFASLSIGSHNFERALANLGQS